jgi:hypothetical protein
MLILVGVSLGAIDFWVRQVRWRAASEGSAHAMTLLTVYSRTES